MSVDAKDMTILADPDRCAGVTTAAEEKSIRIVLDSKPLLGEDVSHEAYRKIAGILQEQQHFYLDAYKEISIKRRLASRIRAAGFRDPEAYIALLQDDAAERQQLLLALSIHVSQFFRNPSSFAVLEKVVIPELLGVARKTRTKLRLWSVGCANGEEPYSLALLCRKLIRAEDQVAIIGTDISAAALKKARQGFFPEKRLTGVNPELLASCFERQGNDEYRLNEELRNSVQFFRHDILVDQPFYRADLILCRNLLIYFSRDQQRFILETLAGALQPGGVLMLGRAETLAPDCRNLFHCLDPAERIYRRAG